MTQREHACESASRFDAGRRLNSLFRGVERPTYLVNTQRRFTGQTLPGSARATDSARSSSLSLSEANSPT